MFAGASSLLRDTDSLVELARPRKVNLGHLGGEIRTPRNACRTPKNVCVGGYLKDMSSLLFHENKT